MVIAENGVSDHPSAHGHRGEGGVSQGKLKGRRMLTFEGFARPALRPLPTKRFDDGEWKIDCGVNLDYHVDVDGHYYSVHDGRVHERADARTGTATVDLFHRGCRVAAHLPSYQKGDFTTLPEHMPALHRKHAEWTPERVARWAGARTGAAAELVAGAPVSGAIRGLTAARSRARTRPATARTRAALHGAAASGRPRAPRLRVHRAAGPEAGRESIATPGSPR